MFSAVVGVVFSNLLESESGFQKCWSRSRESKSVFKKWGVGVEFFELEQFMGWSRNPKKSSDSTTLLVILTLAAHPYLVVAPGAVALVR